MIETKIYRTDPESGGEKIITECVKALRQGKIIVFPTETVYGLGADMFNAEAVEKIYEIKNRPREKALLCHLVYAQRETAAFMTERAEKLIKAFTPGPLTIILKKKPAVPDIVTAGTDTIGLRFPSNKFAAELITAFGSPIAATSANFSGAPSPKNAERIIKELNGEVDVIVDGGETEYGLESTIISVIGEPEILREGAVSAKKIWKILRS